MSIKLDPEKYGEDCPDLGISQGEPHCQILMDVCGLDFDDILNDSCPRRMLETRAAYESALAAAKEEIGKLKKRNKELEDRYLNPKQIPCPKCKTPSGKFCTETLFWVGNDNFKRTEIESYHCRACGQIFAESHETFTVLDKQTPAPEPKDKEGTPDLDPALGLPMGRKSPNDIFKAKVVEEASDE